MAIDDYAFGRITIDGQSYTSDVIVLADGVRDGWWRKEGHSLAIEDLDAVAAAAPAVLVVGVVAKCGSGNGKLSAAGDTPGCDGRRRRRPL